MSLKNKKMTGGLVLRPINTSDPKYSLPHDVFYKHFKKGLASEKELCNFNKEYLKLVDKYRLKVESHLDNLDNMDSAFADNINNPDFHGFRKSFEILSENNILEDDLQPLLLKNYEYIYEQDNDADIIEYHLDQQISYLIFNYYNESDQRIFSSVIIKNVMTEPEFQIITKDGKRTDFLRLPHDNYQLNYEKVKKILDQVIDFTKKSIENEKDDSLPLLTKLPSFSKDETNNEIIVNSMLCNQVTSNIFKRKTKKTKESKKIKKTKESKKTKKISKMSDSHNIGNMETININTQHLNTIENEKEPKKISHRVSRKGSRKTIMDFKPTQESLNPPLNKQIINPIIEPNNQNIQDIKISKTAGLPAFKIELPERKVMIPYEKK